MISIIVAVAKNGVIGDKNSLLWHLREDMIHFRTTTSGHPVVMGRKTYDSIGRPLPKRTNVVITRDTNLAIEGCSVVHSIEEAIAMFESTEEVFIIGGAQISITSISFSISFNDCNSLPTAYTSPLSTKSTRVIPLSQRLTTACGESAVVRIFRVARSLNIHFRL